MNTSLQEIVKCAYNKVPFYKRLYESLGINPLDIRINDYLHNLPIVSKNDIQLNCDDFLSEKYFLGCDTLIKQRTSGSTGRFINVYWDKNDYLRSIMNLWIVRTREYGIKPSSKFCSFHTTISNGEKVESPEIFIDATDRHLSFRKIGLDDIKLHKFFEYILEFYPEWLLLQPSIALIFAEFIYKNNLKIPESLKYIELTGEYLPNNHKEHIEGVFSVPVANMYGCMETNGIAIECRYGNMHCLKNNVIVEILRQGKPVAYGEEGDIHITCLTNKAMPFIRYAIGDKGILHSGDDCKCGNKAPILKILAGRVNENVSLDVDKFISPNVFLYAIERINSMQDNPISQFQVIQTDYKKFIVKIVLYNGSKASKDSIIKQFKDEMIKEIPTADTEWNISFYNQILPDDSVGKYKFFINLLRNNS